MIDLSHRNNFLITGHGRSATAFLADVMNQSKRWKVRHEARGATDEVCYNLRIEYVPNELVKDFDRDFYGEVNSTLRFYLNRIKFGKVGLIVRQPKDILLSSINRGHDFMQITERLKRSWNIMTDYINSSEDVYIIEFKKLVNNKEYLQKVLHHFGIKDVNVDDIEMKKKNASKERKYLEYSSLPKMYREYFEQINWKL